MNRRHFLCTSLAAATPALAASRTQIAIDGDRFLINGKATYAGRSFRGKKIEGLLMNSRMVQGIYDDLNPETRMRWVYPDTKKWDAGRNTNEFIAAMPVWRQHGLLSFTINLQGGSPEGYSKGQPWENNAYDSDGTLRKPYLERLRRILDRADELGMAPIVGFFYFGQVQRLKDEAAVKRGTENAAGWLLDRGYRNILVEIANETNDGYFHPILRPARIHELIEQVKGMRRQGFRLLAGASTWGNATLPTPNVVKSSDFVLIHGNGVAEPARIAKMVRDTRQIPGYRSMPVLFNEDDHFDFDKPSNNMLAAVGEYASWGYFDPGKSNYSDGYQCPPVNWGLSTERKKAFFSLLKEVTGA
jgi:hypothetical protein